MRKIIFSICIALLPIMILPMLARKSNNKNADYISINRVVNYFSTISDTGVTNSLLSNLTKMNDIIEDGYNFGDGIKITGYANLVSIQFMLVPFQIIGKFIGFIPYYVNAT